MVEANPVKTALITGASAGIGLEFAKVFAAQQYDVILVARREKKLNEIATEIKAQYGQLAHVIAADLSDPSAPEAIYRQVKEKGLRVDALVNNAGYAINAGFLEADWKTHADFMQVLNTSLVHMCHLFGNDMKANNWGRIINVASVAAFSPQMKGSLYGPAKAFVVGVSQAIDLELREHNVYCTALCPGFTYSEFHDVMGIKAMVERLPRFLWMDAHTVAVEGFSAVMDGKPVYINGLVNQGITQVLSHLPLGIKQLIAKQQEKML
ncbi:MAG: short-chain dehydrogenase [Gammaproteobacteria bacterium]|nr:MAG: short-chain dehydrogenase [Gammaproteobacteria bacterium]